MTAADIRCTLCCISIALLSLLATAYAQPCARFYLQGLDSTTTFYPQLAGVYKLATGLLSILVSVIVADIQYFCLLIINLLLTNYFIYLC